MRELGKMLNSNVVGYLLSPSIRLRSECAMGAGGMWRDVGREGRRVAHIAQVRSRRKLEFDAIEAKPDGQRLSRWLVGGGLQLPKAAAITCWA